MVKLREYQSDVLDECILSLHTRNKCLMVLPTGGGKTQIMSFIIDRMNLKTLVVAHTKELITQLEETIYKNSPHLRKSVTVCTIQKACRRSWADIDFLIIDEAHRSASKSYRKLISSTAKDAYLLGATATPFRKDEQSIFEIFGFPDKAVTILDLIDQGYLCDIRGYRFKTNTVLTGIRRSKGDFQSKSLAAVIDCKDRNDLIVTCYKNKARGKKTIAFCANIEHCEELSKTFRDQGISSKSIHGNLSLSERKKRLKEFKGGEISVLTNCQILTEGFDEPSIECILLCRPTFSKGLYIQMIGRGLRIFPGKVECLAIEFTDNLFDICSLESILECGNSNFKMSNGETISAGGKRHKAELIEGDHEVVEEEIYIIPKDIYKRMATTFQKKILDDNNISYSKKLTEHGANTLIATKFN